MRLRVASLNACIIFHVLMFKGPPQKSKLLWLCWCVASLEPLQSLVLGACGERDSVKDLRHRHVSSGASNCTVSAAPVKVGDIDTTSRPVLGL